MVAGRTSKTAPGARWMPWVCLTGLLTLLAAVSSETEPGSGAPFGDQDRTAEPSSRDGRLPAESHGSIGLASGELVDSLDDFDPDPIGSAPCSAEQREYERLTPDSPRFVLPFLAAPLVNAPKLGPPFRTAC